MNASVQKQKSPCRRPLEVNEIDHIVRCYGGHTLALEMEPAHMQNSKRSENVIEHNVFLTHRNGELRLEATFYRECFQYAEMFKDRITKLSQDLLHECIIGLLDDAAFGEIRTISKSISDAVDELRENQKIAFDGFIAPYKIAQGKSPSGLSYNNGFI